MVEKTKSSEQEIVEQGNIYFAYRPRVRGEDEADEPEGLDEVQNLYMVLKPAGGRFRLINIGRKRLPEIEGHERNWGFVEMVEESGKAIEQELRRDTYQTKTRGERVEPAVRPAGEGVYALVRRGRDMHLAWALELPQRPGEVQKAFNLPPEASLVVEVRNPEKGGGPRSVSGRSGGGADYPEDLQATFRDRRFASEDPRLLDYEGAEIVFVGAREDPERAYRIDLQPQEEDAGHADIMRELHLVKSRHPIEPLLEGEWR